MTKIYYASGGDYGDSLYLVIEDTDVGRLRTLAARANAIFTLLVDDSPDSVSWYFNAKVIENEGEALGDLLDDMDDWLDLTEEQALLVEAAPYDRHDAMQAHYHRGSTSASITWYREHCDQEYFVSINLIEKE